MRVLLTGASGFVGVNLRQRLVDKGYEVFATDTWGKNLDATGDLRDTTFILSLFSKNKFEVVVHSAAAVPLMDNIELFNEVNSKVSQNLAKIAKDQGVDLFVFISSSALYGRPQEFPITPKTPVKPVEPYGESKLVAEKLICEFWNIEKDLIIVRPRTIIGAKRYGIFEILFRWASFDLHIPLPNGGNHYLQLVHIEDLCALVEHLIANGIIGIWPAGAENHNRLSDDLIGVFIENQSKSKIINVNPKLFQFAGRILNLLRLSPFTPWHYSTMDSNFGFDSKWKPSGFDYKYSNYMCLDDAFKYFKLGKTSQGYSAHTRSWPTWFLDFSLRIFTFLRKFVRK